jgi:hypothetical protein
MCDQNVLEEAFEIIFFITGMLVSFWFGMTIGKKIPKGKK